MRLLKTHVLLRLVNSYIVDSPQPANISYLWNFGSLLATCLVIQILTGVFLAMHYQPHVDFAFNSVEHAASFSSFIQNSQLLMVSYRDNNKISKVGNKNLSLRQQTKNLTKTSASSNINNINKIKMEDKDFYEWLRGFTDGEGSFAIIPSETGNSYKFKYSINLHKDDSPLLFYIQKRLNIGAVYEGKHFSTFIASSKSDVEKLIYIFDNYPLNTSKYLNYMCWRKAFHLYTDNVSLNSLSIPHDTILNFKSSMNKNRTNFNLPDNHKINITPYWLLGFIEGEGYFSVGKSLKLEFGIGQTLSELEVIKSIIKFLMQLPGDYKLLNSKSNPVQFYQESKPKNPQSNPMVRVSVFLSFYINNVLIPFLDSLIWLSKKELDYLDWKSIINLKNKGLHFTEEGKKVITNIANRMNRNRLTTNKDTNSETDFSLNNKIEYLLNQPSNYEVHSNGKILIKSLGVYLKGRGEVEIEVFDEKNSLIKRLPSIKATALYFNTSDRTIIRKLDNGAKFLFNSQYFTLKRVIFPIN